MDQSKYYNNYLTPTSLNFGYSSQIAFINTNYPILTSDIFYVEYDVCGKTRKELFKSDAYLTKVYFDIRNIPNYSDNRIKNMSHTRFFHSYVKILKDSQNPQLEGQIMIMKFGRYINDKIQNSFLNGNRIFDHTFNLNIKLTQGFSNYGDSYFTNNYMVLTDNTLDITSEIKFKTFNSIAMERKEKLKKIIEFEG